MRITDTGNTLGSKASLMLRNTRTWDNGEHSCGLTVRKVNTTDKWSKFELVSQYDMELDYSARVHLAVRDSTGQVVANDSTIGWSTGRIWQPWWFRNYRPTDSLMIDNAGSYAQGIIKGCASTDSIAVWKRTASGNELMQMSASTARTVMGAATTVQIGDSIAAHIHARTDTLVIMFGADSLCFKAITP
jgi:hypothetical protein